MAFPIKKSPELTRVSNELYSLVRRSLENRKIDLEKTRDDLHNQTLLERIEHHRKYIQYVDDPNERKTVEETATRLEDLIRANQTIQ